MSQASLSSLVDPEDADYECSLTEASLAKAMKELHEDPKQRLGAVQTLRQWIRQQPHFTCRTDTDFLLQVLRTAKFSQLRAREIIEVRLKLRDLLPDYCINLDSCDPVTHFFIDCGTVLPLTPSDAEGRGVLLIRPGMADLSDPRYSEKNEIRAALTIEAVLKGGNENVIVNGELLIYDLTGITAKHVARATVERNDNVRRLAQESHLGRMKGAHIYNGGPMFEMIISFIRPFLKKKFADRVRVHSTMESLYKVVPMELWPDEYLPDDYTGPSAGPISGIIENLKKKLMDPDFRTRLREYTDEKYGVHNDVQKPLKVRQESFRKLAVD